MDHDPLFLVFTLLCLSTAATAATNFTYSSFSANDPNITVLNATTKGQNTGHASILLTSSQIFNTVFNASGRAFYSFPIQLYDPSTNLTTNFTTYFEFQIFFPNQANINATSGGGFAFFLTSQNKSSVVPQGSAAGMLGLFSQTDNGNDSNQIVAVEFDTFRDPWDPSSNHVGINVNSVASVANRTWNTTLVSNDIYGATISYDGGSNLLSVFLKDPDIPNDFGSLRLSQRVNLREILPDRVMIGFSASTGSAAAIQSIRSWNFTSTLAEIPVAGDGSQNGGGGGDGGGDGRGDSGGFQSWMVGLIAGILVGAAGALYMVRRKRLQKQREKTEAEENDDVIDSDDDDDDSMDEDIGWGSTGPKKFSYKELVAATDNFSEEGKLGQGGFGGVYKGYLKDVEAEFVAVKKVSSGSKQGKKEYISEVMTISRLRHRNLVQLVGYSHKKGSFMLVYEFMHNGSLDAHLFGKNKKVVPLQWGIRFKIAQGLASALLYLHEEWEQCVVHRDIKSSNVMLDSNFNAKLGDFGLAKLIDHNLGSQTTVVAGTMGYMAPEYLMTSKASKESDVYSFGVVALEIACGRKAVEHSEEESKVVLVNWVWELYGRGKIIEAADEALGEEFEKDEIVCLMTVGLWCAHPDHTLRPSIRQAIQVLNFEAVLPSLPHQMPVPSFYAPRIENYNSLSTYTVSSEVTGEMSPCSTSSTQNLIYSSTVSSTNS
ncbi:L-type lectin-domain containing receptor kinase IX.1 [Linum grandiflorum]